MKKPELLSFRAGFTNVYIFGHNNNYLLIDTGSRNQTEKILKSIRARGVDPKELKIIFLTHSHYDHAGSVAEIALLTKAKIILQKSEVDDLKEGFTSIPKGTSPMFKIISSLGRMGESKRKIGWYQPAAADIVFDDSLSLESFGFDAKIIHTPGHTMGSSSLVAGDIAVVGDAMFNLTGKYYPGFANDEKTLRKTWRKLIDLDVNWYYPSHGKRIEKNKLMQEARKRKII